jgi:hypothetical protein
LAIKLLDSFAASYLFLKIKGVKAEFFMREAKRATKQNQVISQIRKNQIVMVNGNFVIVEDHFDQKNL